MPNGVKLKKKSKRMSCKRRYKIEKKVREHNRKLRRKETKAKAKGGGKRGRKERPLEEQVPNSCPFKAEILEEAVAKRKATEEERAARRLSLQEARAKTREKILAEKRQQATASIKVDAAKEPPKTLEELVAGAAVRGEEFALTQASQAEASLAEAGALKEPSSKVASVRSFAGEVRRVLEASDVVFEVLDARDPLGSRCLPIEEQILRAGKRLVLLLNKIDLVPRSNVEAWLAYLRRSLPCIAFKASTQEQRTKLGRAGADLSTVSSKALGAELVLKLLANYSRNRGLKTSIRVGFIGYPNVGKSSVINSLKRGRSCGVGAMPGVTRALQEVQLDSKVRLLDSPGVVLAAKGSMDPVEIALKNAIRLENVSDPVAPVQAILRRCSRQALQLQYNIPEFADATEFLLLLGRRLGMVKKGARTDTNAAARKVLQDWHSGKLRYFTHPPQEAATPAAEQELSHESAQIVAEMRKEFSLEDLDGEQSLLIQDLPATANLDAVLYDKAAAEAAMEEGEAEMPKTEKKSAGEKEEAFTGLSKAEAVLEGNQRVGKAAKAALKKGKKKAKRAEKLGAKLGASLEAAMELDDYDFQEHFPE